MKTRIGWIVVALAAGAAPAFTQHLEGSRSRRTQCGIEISSPAEAGEVGKEKRFSAAGILDLHFTIRVGKKRAAPRPEALKLKILTPNEHLYQELTLPVSWDTPPQRLARVEAPPFPVGGSAIVSNSLYGRWTAVAEIEGANPASGCRIRFRLEP